MECFNKLAGPPEPRFHHGYIGFITKTNLESQEDFYDSKKVGAHIQKIDS